MEAAARVRRKNEKESPPPPSPLSSQYLFLSIPANGPSVRPSVHECVVSSSSSFYFLLS